MKRFILTLLSILLCMLLVKAELLWKIEGPGVHTSYIFGTHHVAPTSMADSVTGLTEALKATEMVCGELVMTDLMSPAGQQKLMSAGMAPADSTLSKVLTAAQCDSLTAFLQKYLGPQMSLSNIDRLKPAMISSTVAMVLNQQVMQESNISMPLDGLLQTLAINDGKPVGGLETIDDQTKALFGSPITEQAASLMQVVRDGDGQIELVRRMASMYMSGNLDGLYKLMTSPEGGMTAAERKSLITDRNHAWIAPMKEMMAGHAVLFAVGAGHLPGPDGVLELLRQANLTVTPVNSSDDI